MTRLRHIRPVRVLAVAVAAFGVLTCAASASAAGNTYKIRLTPDGQAAARASLLKLSDVGSDWRGGPTQVSKFSSSVCPDYHPKYSDLVVTGQAAAEFSQPGAVVRTETHVLASAKMVKLDWQRSIASKNYLSCERKTQAKSSTANERFVSLKKLAFPRIGDNSAAFRLITSFKSKSGKMVPAVYDIVLIARGNTEIVLMTVMPPTSVAALYPNEIVLAKTIAARVRV